ncbi:ankyrin repeat domain-containing protein [Candidatus Mesenet endosymbiont of Phosphuga atrata]|uniref:ankyrin repeat domain-containing protein n=1 Tax=Candidatus Mesenet endosymbiont of Phosphuga atrata TaxID=3066221 RepID=UPI0030CFAC8E
MGLEEQLFDTVLQSSIGESVRLISLGANINAKSKNGNTPIHMAVLCRDALMVKTLAKLKTDVNIKNSLGFTPLFIATFSNNLEIVKILLCLGARRNISDSSGNLPIHIAARTGYQDIVKVLLSEDTVNEYNHDGLTPFHLAVLNNHIDIVETLIIYCHTDINIQDRKNGNTALIFAVQKDNLQIVKFLLKSGADFSKRNKEGKTFNEFAISSEMKSKVSKYGKLLSKLNSDPNQSISPMPLVRKRKKYLSESSSENDDF